MKRPFFERVVVVLWLLCGGVFAVTGLFVFWGVSNISSDPNFGDRVFAIMFVLMPYPLFLGAAVVALFQYLVLGSFSPLVLFRSRK